MKHKLLSIITAFLCTLCLLSISVPSIAAEKFDFRGIRLGSNVEDIKGMYKTGEARFVFEGWTEYWQKKGEKMSIGDITCDEITYSTFFGDIYDIVIKSTDPRKRILKDILASKYGTPHEKDTSAMLGDYIAYYYWNIGNDIEITYKWMFNSDDDLDIVFINYTLLPLRQECWDYMHKVVEEHKKHTIKQGQDDL